MYASQTVSSCLLCRVLRIIRRAQRQTGMHKCRRHPTSCALERPSTIRLTFAGVDVDMEAVVDMTVSTVHLIAVTAVERTLSL